MYVDLADGSFGHTDEADDLIERHAKFVGMKGLEQLGDDLLRLVPLLPHSAPPQA
jgi:hypothetical protein